MILEIPLAKYGVGVGALNDRSSELPPSRLQLSLQQTAVLEWDICVIRRTLLERLEWLDWSFSRRAGVRRVTLRILGTSQSVHPRVFF